MAHIHKPTMSTEVCGQPMVCEQVEWAEASHNPPHWRIKEHPQSEMCEVVILHPPYYTRADRRIYTSNIEEAVRRAMKETK